eukprot:CAMPEP_0114131672 /NCGR_PEP_ID=MMETSP0043_2-20121206/12681_1 /TAXON_ID=464988 /ORGANISM="Hemiselmis andersenii, Strain CCMP644" /LENGTH=172 /DNA_ID=CAMNT_0001225125 /DNA_START=525 /DNA_END=1043 /DNA_ORIENTATION=-
MGLQGRDPAASSPNSHTATRTLGLRRLKHDSCHPLPLKLPDKRLVATLLGLDGARKVVEGSDRCSACLVIEHVFPDGIILFKVLGEKIPCPLKLSPPRVPDTNHKDRLTDKQDREKAYEEDPVWLSDECKHKVEDAKTPQHGQEVSLPGENDDAKAKGAYPCPKQHRLEASF